MSSRWVARTCYGHGRLVVLVAAVIAGVGVLGGCSPSKPSTTATTVSTSTTSPAPTAVPTTSTTTTSSTTTGPPRPISTAAELASLIPSYLSKDLDVSCGSTVLIVAPNTGQATGPIPVASSASAEEPCSNSASQKPETVVLFLAFPDSTSEQAYYNQLLSLNGMTQNSGGCGSQTLVNSAPLDYRNAQGLGASNVENSYCENAYPARGSKSTAGRVFLYSGPVGIWLDANHDSPTAPEPCTFANNKMVLTFTDPSYTAVTIAENCSTNSNDLSGMYSDFSSGKLNLGT